jgi:hypothetical protein
MEVSDEEYKKMLLFAMEEIGNAYNWLWIFFAQILNWNIKGNGDWFCSEFVCRVLQKKCLFCPVSSLFISPWKLAYMLENQGFKINQITWKELELINDTMVQ